MIRTAATIGILPQHLYNMELWEFNACVAAYNEKRKDDAINQIHSAWQIGYFCGLAFNGKLRKVETYIKDTVAHPAPYIDINEFNEKLKDAFGDNSDGEE